MRVQDEQRKYRRRKHEGTDGKIVWKLRGKKKERERRGGGVREKE